VRRIDRSSDGTPVSASIYEVLTDFSTGRLGFKEAKATLSGLVVGNLNAE
jgi:hypothetical protein